MVKIALIENGLTKSSIHLIKELALIFELEIQVYEPKLTSSYYDAFVLFEPSESMLKMARDSNRPFLVYMAKKIDVEDIAKNIVSFSSSQYLPKILHEKEMVTDEVKKISGLSFKEPFEVLAQVQNKPVWVTLLNHKNQYYTSVGFLELESQDHLAQYLNGERFLRLLPLYCFFRFCVCKMSFVYPPLRACIVVDDPNLHWSDYGPINYANIAKYCRENKCHFSFATVPIDCWFTHSVTAKLFNENKKYLSLLFHGNNHSKAELAQTMKRQDAIEYYSQAIRRIKMMEKKTGLKVDNVMAPPHGQINESTALVLYQLGIKAVCTNRWSLWQKVPPKKLETGFGIEIGSFLNHKMPVLNRFRLVSPICKNEIIIAGLLGMPIIPYCHVGDFKRSFKDIEKAVSFINQLGDVQWMSTSDISTSNFLYKTEDYNCCVKAYSNLINFKTPEKIKVLRIEKVNPNINDNELKIRVKKVKENNNREYQYNQEIPTTPEEEWQIAVNIPQKNNGEVGKDPGFHFTSFMRRLATELRDRYFP